MMGFNAPILKTGRRAVRPPGQDVGLEPLMTPLSVSTPNRTVMAYIREQLAGTRLIPVQAGGAGAGGGPVLDKVVPGASLVVPFLIGDLDMSAVGTVTEVVGNRILGLGHSMMAEGSIELPMATGKIHTPISSLYASFKLGSTSRLVGTLLRDEETGVYGITGRQAQMVPTKVTVTDDNGERTYHYRSLHHRQMTPWILTSGLMQSILANRDLPQEHTLRYTVSVGYKALGTFAVDNVSSMNWLSDIRSDLAEPMSMLMDNQFGRAQVAQVNVRVSVEPKAAAAKMERVDLIRSEFKPGETVTLAVRWRPYRAEAFTKRYSMDLPDDLPDGSYELGVGSGRSHLMALRGEKPHLFRVESLGEMMAAVQRIGGVRSNRVYMRLRIKRGGVAIGKTEMPELPTFRKQIFDEARLHAVQAYAEPIVVEHRVPFVVSGERRFKIKVDRRADQ
jgi:hypothetical protein